MLASVVATAQGLGGLRKLLESVRGADERRRALEARLGLLERYLVPDRELPGDVNRVTQDHVAGLQRATASLQGLAGEPRFLLEASRFDESPPQKAVDDLAFACTTNGFEEPPYLDQALAAARETLRANAAVGHATILCRYRAVKEGGLGALAGRFEIFGSDCSLRTGVDRDLAGWVSRLPSEAVPASLDEAVAVLAKVKGPRVVLLVTEGATAPDGWPAVSGEHAIAWARAVEADDRAWHATAAIAPRVWEMGKKASVLVEKGAVSVQLKFTRTGKDGRGAILTGTALLRVTRSDVVLEKIHWASKVPRAGWRKGENNWTKDGEWKNNEGRLYLMNPTPQTQTSVQYIGEMRFTVTPKGESAIVSMTCHVPPEFKTVKGWEDVYTIEGKPKTIPLPDDGGGLEFPDSGVVVL